MNTKALNSLADLICRAQEQDRTPMGIAFAVDAAGRHMSPEVAAELKSLRAEVAALREERHVTNEALSEAAEALRANRDRIAALEAQLAADHVTWQHDLRTARTEREATAVRIAELEALTPARHQTCRVCGAGYVYGEPCSHCEFRARMEATAQARVRQPYRAGHDLPGLGGQR